MKTSTEITRVGKVAIYNSQDENHREHVYDHQTGSFDANRGVDMRIIKGMHLYHIIKSERGYSLQEDGKTGVSKLGWFEAIEDLLDAFSNRISRNKCDAVFVVESPVPVSYVWTDLL